VKLVDPATGATIPQSGSGTLSVSSGACSVTSPSKSTTTGELNFTGLTGSGVGTTCTVKADVTFASVTYPSLYYGPFPVFDDGNLACGTTNDPVIIDWSTSPASIPPNQFDGSPGVNIIDLPSYYKGARGANIIDATLGKTAPCDLVNYTIVNNVPPFGNGSPQTIGGKTVPVNGVALFWDDVAQPNATFKTLQTFRDEWTNASGWISKRTKVCTDNACTEDLRVPLKACLGTTLTLASMPFFDAPNGAVRMPVCIVAETWATVPVSNCNSATRPNLNSGCVRVTSELLILADPVMIRD